METNKEKTGMDLVYDSLKDGIIKQKLGPGTPLTEHSLCDSLGVGRSPVRRALQALAEEGYIELIPNKGAFVTSFTKVQLTHLYSFRVELEIYALRLAMDRFTEKDFAFLESCHRREKEAVRDRDFKAYLDAVAKFHCYLVEKACNPYLSAAFLRVINRVAVYLSLYDNFYSVPAPHSLDNNEQLLEALRSGRQKKAAAILNRLSEQRIHAFDQKMMFQPL